VLLLYYQVNRLLPLLTSSLLTEPILGGERFGELYRGSLSPYWLNRAKTAEPIEMLYVEQPSSHGRNEMNLAYSTY